MGHKKERKKERKKKEKKKSIPRQVAVYKFWHLASAQVVDDEAGSNSSSKISSKNRDNTKYNWIW